MASKPKSPLSSAMTRGLRQRPGSSRPHGSSDPSISATATTSAMDDPTRLLLESKTQKAKKVGKRTKNETSSTSTSPLLSGKEDSSQKAATESEQSQAGGAGAEPEMENKSRKSEWIILAIASGACAAFNGVFAKLTTTELTSSFATAIANFVGLGDGEKSIEVVIRAMFFGLNLIFNGVMWTLFTKALARGTSTTQVSIINTSSNFMITAVLGFFIFTESLPPLWWVGAAMLVAGNVIIGRREEKEIEARPDSQGAAENGESNYSGSDSDGEVILPEEGQLEDALKSRDEEDLLDLNADAVESPTAERSTRSRK